MAQCHWLTDEAGFDAAIDYKSENVQAQLKELCPKEIDIFFDNVGGDILDALARLVMRGRVVLCGGIANFNVNEPPPGPKNYLNLIVQRVRMEGFIILDYVPRAAEAIGAPAGCVQAGRSRTRSTCSVAWRTRRRRGGGCSRLATKAGSSCVSRK